MKQMYDFCINKYDEFGGVDFFIRLKCKKYLFS